MHTDQKGGGNMDKPVIILSKDRNARAWVAQFVGDVSILSAFGTDTIPTPFTLDADAETVRQAVQVRNPGHIIEIRR